MNIKELQEEEREFADDCFNAPKFFGFEEEEEATKYCDEIEDQQFRYGEQKAY